MIACAVASLCRANFQGFLAFVLMAGFFPLFSRLYPEAGAQHPSLRIRQAKWICNRRYKFKKIWRRRPDRCNVIHTVSYCKHSAPPIKRCMKSTGIMGQRFQKHDLDSDNRHQEHTQEITFQPRRSFNEQDPLCTLFAKRPVKLSDLRETESRRNEVCSGLNRLINSLMNSFHCCTKVVSYSTLAIQLILIFIRRLSYWNFAFVKSKAYCLGWIDSKSIKCSWRHVVFTAFASVVPLCAICVCHSFSSQRVVQLCLPIRTRTRQQIHHPSLLKKHVGRWCGGMERGFYQIVKRIQLSFLYPLMTRFIYPIAKSWRQWFLLLFLLCMPVGEAQNPGPLWFHEPTHQSDVLWIGNANPTQLLNKECCLSEWGSGIWTFSETSATDKAILSIRSRANLQGFNIQFGAPVPRQQKNSIMRGKAGGVATASDYPIKMYSYPMPNFLHSSTRFMDCIVQLGEGHSIYVSTIYGVAGQSSAHHHSLTIDIINQATERALSYKGPAVICGDFNVPLESLDSWEILKDQGWFDAAYVDSMRFQRELQSTSKHGSRHSFVLMNRYLAPSFHACRTAAHFDFDSHPLLVAGFNLSLFKKSKLTWIIPKSFDDFMFDNFEIEKNTKVITENRSSLFRAAIELSNMEEAARQFTIAAEEIFKESAVDSEGFKVNIPPGYFGRFHKSPYRSRSQVLPVVRKARDGDFQPLVSQVSCSLRLHTKQLRRISALTGQLQSWENTHNMYAYWQCQQLWDKILGAHGFHGCFRAWIVRYFANFVPLKVPDSQFVASLEASFRAYHNENLQKHYLANHAIARINADKDIQMGGSKCFQDVKDIPVAPLDAIHWTEKCEIVRTTWSKNGKDKLPIRNKPAFDLSEDVEFQGQKRKVLECTDNHIVLDRPVVLKKGGNAYIEQHKSSAEPDDMHTQLAKFWGSLWQRDSSDESLQTWTEAERFITCLADCPSCEYRDITHDIWCQNLQGVKTKSARGADGFSTKDFKNVRYQLLDWLLEIIRCIEQNNHWPAQWSISKVTVLSKGSKPRSPLDIRPITILPKVYRLWSRLRSLEVLNHLKNQMPPQVAATAGRVSADQIAAFSAFVIEQANHCDKSVCGLIIDLIKCYNTVPWHPCKLLFRHLGIPDEYSKPFFQFMSQLERSFQINGHCGQPVTCTTGIPEGCAMSVAVMAALSWWCYAALKSLHPNIDTICYADNWGILTETSQELFEGTTTVFKFVQALKMQVSIPKSWFWGSSANIRRSLRQAPDHLKEIPVVHHAVDLGCDQNYTQKKYNVKFKQRIQKAKRVLKRIAKKSLPKRFRPTITQSAGFGAMCYGIELNKIPDNTWSHLRTAVSGALGRGKAGANPFLSCLFTKAPADPQLKAIIRSLFFWRRFFKSFVNTKTQFCNSLLLQKGLGPAANLARSLLAIGWKPIVGNLLQHTDGAFLDWTMCSNSHLKKTLRLFWSHHVSSKIQHRKDFDLASIDEYNMLVNLNRFPEKQKAAIVAHFTGAAYTNDIISKYSTTGDLSCKFCGQADSRRHRLFQCEHFQNIRPRFRQVLEWVSNQPLAVQNLAVLPKHPGIFDKLLVHARQWPPNRCPEASEITHNVFCDGSAYWQDQPTCTIAGAAAIVVTDNGLLEHILAAEPLPGYDHNSYRAEVFGILLALQKTYRPKIYSDCQSAVDQLSDLIQSRNFETPPIFKDHTDIWKQVWEQICARDKGCICVFKTKAHLNPDSLSCPQQKWEATANNLVDQIAKNAVCNWQPVFSAASDAYAEIKHNATMHKQLLDLIVEQNDTTSSGRTSSLPVVNNPSEFLEMVPRPEDCRVFVIDNPTIHCPFGAEFLDRVVRWASALSWPVNPTMQISMIELYIDFTIFTKSLTPVPISKGNDRRVTKYGLCDLDVDAKVVSHNLAQQSVIWTRFHKWARCHNIHFWDAQYISQASCLGHVGYTLRSPAISNRPLLTHRERASTVLSSLFRTGSGNQRSLGISYNGPP